ncbi:MAG: heavy metal sensor histidine kinase [Burkholderiaceae bacterium]|nr:heavy metal sensor histidine kinase [Burkholderiaceae bacterium]
MARPVPSADISPLGFRYFRASLAARLALLFAAGLSALLLILGVWLAWMLRVQLEARDREEIDGKTEVVLYLLRELHSADQIQANANRFAEIAIGHPHLQIGLRHRGQWLVAPTQELQALIGRNVSDTVPSALAVEEVRMADGIWWLRRLRHVVSPSNEFIAYVAVDVSPAQQLLERFIGAMLVAGALGILASAALGWVIARRGLAPISVIAREAERVTANRLGQPLRSEDAPAEIRGLIESINRMLERLQASFRTLEEFSADIAHELRTPLNNLLLQTQVTLGRERTPAEYEDALHSNLAEVERLQRMVSDMLFLARVDRGMLKLNLETVDLAGEARNVAEFFEAAAAEQGKKIEVTGNGTAACDRSMARRAITNLLSNAVRYSEAGAAISVSVAPTAQEFVALRVENDAHTLGASELQRLFGRFTRGPNAHQSTAEGAGLGLSIVDSIMRLHGGRVEAESGPYGVRFQLLFPAAL